MSAYFHSVIFLRGGRCLKGLITTGVNVDNCAMLTADGHVFHPVYQCGYVAWEDVQRV
jgi:hypothetical protein